MESNQINNDLFDVSDSTFSSISSPPKSSKKLHKQQISVTINPGLLKRIDAMAEESGQSRAAMINMAIFQMSQQGIRWNPTT